MKIVFISQTPCKGHGDFQGTVDQTLRIAGPGDWDSECNGEGSAGSIQVPGMSKSKLDVWSCVFPRPCSAMWMLVEIRQIVQLNRITVWLSKCIQGTKSRELNVQCQRTTRIGAQIWTVKAGKWRHDGVRNNKIDGKTGSAVSEQDQGSIYFLCFWFGARKLGGDG